MTVMAFEREEIRLAGGVLTYWVAGSGSPMVYIHGGEGVQTSDALRRLSQGRRIYVPVLPGFDGVAMHGEVRSVRQLAGLVGNFIERMVGGPCDIVGHSFGGWVALWLAADKPGCVDHLILESPLGVVPESRAQLTGGDGIATARLHAHPERVTATDKPADIARQNRQALARYATAGAADDVMSALPDVPCVTLLLAGADDMVATPDTIRLLKSRMRKCYLIYVYDAAHMIEVDQPGRFHGVVTDFLTWGEAFLVNRADQRTPSSREADAAYG
jgi:pimeloyl-ACP methyl ester carboxylesterase